MSDVLVAIPPRRVTHLPTGDTGTVLGVDADGYQVVLIDGERHPLSLKDEVLAPAPPVKVLACEVCSTRPATVHDAYTDQVACRVCYPDLDTAYCMEFVLSYIPDNLNSTYPPRPTIPVAPDPPHRSTRKAPTVFHLFSAERRFATPRWQVDAGSRYPSELREGFIGRNPNREEPFTFRVEKDAPEEVGGFVTLTTSAGPVRIANFRKVYPYTAEDAARDRVLESSWLKILGEPPAHLHPHPPAGLYRKLRHLVVHPPFAWRTVSIGDVAYGWATLMVVAAVAGMLDLLPPAVVAVWIAMVPFWLASLAFAFVVYGATLVDVVWRHADRRRLRRRGAEGKPFEIPRCARCQRLGDYSY